jgi:hypothetical protein
VSFYQTLCWSILFVNINILFLHLGVACVVIGLVILFLDLRYPDDITLFFGIDPLADYEEYHLSKKLLLLLFFSNQQMHTLKLFYSFISITEFPCICFGP